jgi:hypothetical protein
MRATAVVYVALALTVFSCQQAQTRIVTHRRINGQADQWVTRTAPGEYQIEIDTNGDGKPDLIRTFRNNEMVEVQSDRNFNGKVDLVQQYSNGVLVREVHDDDFDGRPELVKTFRPNGTLAIVERDPAERGSIDVIEFYDDSGHLTRRELRTKQDRGVSSR